MELIIKDEFLNNVVGFNNSSLPLGNRNDLHVLFEIATKSKNERLLGYFKEIPTSSEFDKIKEDQILEETKPSGNELTNVIIEKQPTKRSRKAESNS